MTFLRPSSLASETFSRTVDKLKLPDRLEVAKRFGNAVVEVLAWGPPDSPPPSSNDPIFLNGLPVEKIMDSDYLFGGDTHFLPISSDTSEKPRY